MVNKVISLTERLNLEESEALMSMLDEKRKDTMQIKLLLPYNGPRKIIRYAVGEKSVLSFDYGERNEDILSGIPVTLVSPNKRAYSLAKSLLEKPLELLPLTEEAYDR
jgi:hypothetical protein